MEKRFSIYHFLIALLIFSLFSPVATAFANTDVNGSGNGDTEGTGSLTIHKYEQEKGTDRGEGDGTKIDGLDGKPLAGVEYTLIQTHSFDPETDTWTEVSGSAKEYTTNDNGRIVINDIDLGRYTVQETAWPDNVVGNNEEFTVDIPMTSKDGSELNYNVHIYPKNETIRGGAKLIKYVNDTEEMLDGVQFKVFDAKGNVIKDDNGNELVLITEGGTVTVDGLAYGDYYFQEIESTDEYLLNGEKVEFSVTEQDAMVEVSLQNYLKPEVEKNVDKEAVNRGEKVTFTITVDLPNDITEYGSFVIKDVLHEDLEYVDGSQSGATGFNFDQDGQTLTWTAEDFDSIESGTVEITFKAKVSEDAAPNEPIENEAEIDYDNGWQEGGDKTPPTTVTPTVGSLKVIKQDGDSKKLLPGAEFDLVRDGKVVASEVTDDDGEIFFDNLDYATYELVETKAPGDYNKLQNPIEVKINEDNQNAKVTVDNFKTGWDLPTTGGIGTTIFTLVGTILMATALYIYIRRRKETA